MKDKVEHIKHNSVLIGNAHTWINQIMNLAKLGDGLEESPTVMVKTKKWEIIGAYKKTEQYIKIAGSF